MVIFGINDECCNTHLTCHLHALPNCLCKQRRAKSLSVRGLGHCQTTQTYDGYSTWKFFCSRFRHLACLNLTSSQREVAKNAICLRFVHEHHGA